ncbi:MAG: hypothetical protein IT426_14845 [Pirellulales bacterium]|nr:hypothetical protein [Pirellulales bacterium]
MTTSELDILKQSFAGKTVTVDAQRPELVRMAELRGKVITVNCNGGALVQFEGPDSAWYEIEPEYLKIEE